MGAFFDPTKLIASLEYRENILGEYLLFHHDLRISFEKAYWIALLLQILIS